MQQLVLLALLIPCGWAAGAGTNLEAFDHANCQIWRLSDETVPARDAMTAGQRRLVDESLRKAPDQPAERWMVGGTVFAFQRNPAELELPVGTVLCVGMPATPATGARAADSVLACVASTSERMQPYTFRARPPQRAPLRPPTYRCAPDCNGQSVTHVYGLAWEDGPENLDHGPAGKRFHSRCRR